MPRTTIRFDDDRWWARGRLLKGFAVAAALSVAGWQFAKWWQNPIDHESVKSFNDYVTLGDVKISDPFSAMMKGMGVREGEGATLGTQTFAEAYERTKELADQVDPRTVAREVEAKNILESYERFLQTHSLPNQKYEFLRESMLLTLGTIQYEDEKLRPYIDPLFKAFRQAARDAFADVRMQALRDPDFNYDPLLARASRDSYNTGNDPDAEKYRNMRKDADNEIFERRKQFKPAPE